MTVTKYQIFLGEQKEYLEVVLEPNSCMCCRMWYNAFEVFWLCYNDDSEN